MALRFRLRPRQTPTEQLAEQVASLLKASLPGLGTLPAGTTTSSVRDAAQAPGARGTPDAALPRTDPLVAFGPGRPLYPAPLDPARPSGRAEPRRYEYPVSWNLHTTPRQGRLLEWKVLRDFADRVDLVRKCLDLRKKEIVAIPWDITVHPRAVRKVMRQSGERSRPRAAAALQDQLEEQIDALCDWWEQPDRQSGLGWVDWLMMALEEHLVLDALTVYPRLSRGGSLYSFELLDGSTIKPLLDYRGTTPLPPQPAYQQILYGFPRGEFVASDPGEVDGEYASDQLVYRPRDRRTNTPYGFSDVEKALLAGDLWLRRQQWIRAEYTEGAPPETWVTSDADMPPSTLKAYEGVLNDELAGDVAERHRIKLLAKGLNPVDMPQFAEKYTAEYDEHLVRLVCAMLDVQPTEIGFTPRHGIGGQGHEQGQAEVGKRKSLRPALGWLISVLNWISYTHLGMPAELTFTFQGLETEDEAEDAGTRDRDLRNGSRTLNQVQAELGQPLYDFPEADMPWVDTGGQLVFLEGASEPAPAPVLPGGPLPPGPEDPAGGGRNPTTAQQAQAAVEARKFAAFAAKRAKSGKAWRDFAFAHLDQAEAQRLNALGQAGDLDLVKAAVADMGKVGARQERARPREVQDWPGWKFDQAIARHYAPILLRALERLIGDPRSLATEYLRVHGRGTT